MEVPYDDQQEQQLHTQVPDVEQELLPNNNNDISGMLTVAYTSSSAQVEDCQRQLTEYVVM